MHWRRLSPERREVECVDEGIDHTDGVSLRRSLRHGTAGKWREFAFPIRPPICRHACQQSVVAIGKPTLWKLARLGYI